MTDPSTEELVKRLAQEAGQCLWLADESHRAVLPRLRAYAEQLTLVTNRFDVAQQAGQQGLQCRFSDWQFADAGPYKRIFLRICKEKPVNLHLLRESFRLLPQHGTLVISGEKNEGIKSFWQNAVELFQEQPRLEKTGPTYVAEFRKTRESDCAPGDDYHSLQVIAQWRQQPLYSKPGVYGWNKIDQGSALLVAELPAVLQAHTDPISSILDLGCGYGFLTVASADLPCSRRVATDNNAAALVCMQRNAEIRNMAIEIIAGDCGNTVTGCFDLILCNPPFHRGFDIDSTLTRDFLIAARNRLSSRGVAVFVVNSFIPLEKKLQGLFGRVRVSVNNKQFKVLSLQL